MKAERKREINAWVKKELEHLPKIGLDAHPFTLDHLEKEKEKLRCYFLKWV